MFSIDHSLYPQLVSGIFGLLGTVVAAFVGKEFVSRKRLQEKLLVAQADIAFLLQVEEMHCAKLRTLCNASYKLRIRKEAMGSGLTWSGRFTPGRLRGNSSTGATITTTVTARVLVAGKWAGKAAVHLVFAIATYVKKKVAEHAANARTQQTPSSQTSQ